MTETERLVRLTTAVRESSVKRFERVRPRDRSWSPRKDVHSFADCLRHLVDCDVWFLEKMKGHEPGDVRTAPGSTAADEWKGLMDRLRTGGRTIARSIGDASLSGAVDDETWWLITRDHIDHEIHHRGMLQLALRLKYGGT